MLFSNLTPCQILQKYISDFKVRNLLESKQRELTQSMMKVDKITQALAELQGLNTK